MALIYEVIVCLKRTYYLFNVNTIIQNLNCQNLDAKYCGSLFFSSALFIDFEVFFFFVLAICCCFFFAVISRSCDLPFYFMHSVRIKLNV